jgi:tetratricopeptide (TPR) repeat protein
MEFDQLLDLSILDPELLASFLSQLSQSESQIPVFYSGIGTGLLKRFELTGSIDDLIFGIIQEEKALEMTPSDSPLRTEILNNLGSGLMRRFEIMGSMDDIHRSIETLDQALQSVPAIDDSIRAGRLSNLADALVSRFERTGSMEDLDRAIDLGVQSTSHFPNHPKRAMYLASLGLASLSRFERRGLIEDLERALESQEQSVQLTPLEHPDRAMYLSNLADSLQRQFERKGSIEVLDRAVETSDQAVQLTPRGPDRPLYLNTLGNVLESRFEVTGSMEDLDRAIEAMEEATQLTPLGQPRRAMYLNSLGNGLQRRFERAGSMEDLDRSIATREESVESVPLDHPKRARYLINLAAALNRRFQSVNSMQDINRAIEASNQAVQASPLDHPDQPFYLNTLGRALHWRSRQGTQSMEDLDLAIKASKHAVQSTPLGYPNRTVYLYNLAVELHDRFERIGLIEDLEGSISAYENSANSDTSPPSIRLKSARACAGFLVSQGMRKRAKPILEAAVELLPRLSPRLLKRTDAQFNISQFSSLTASAVSLSLEDMDDPWKSLQLLELGRGILANSQIEVRSDISVLEADHPELGRQFRELRDQIDSTPTRFESGIMGPQANDVNSTSNSSKLIFDDRRKLVKQFDNLLAKIRSLKGFENFLKGPSEKELRSLAEGGAIVVFNVSDIRSDAFLITTDGIRSVNLPLLTPDIIRSYAKSFLETIFEQDVTRYSHATRKLNSVLKGLWDCGVKVILDELRFTKVPSGSQKWPRVWWVGSGLLNILPIHAAGYHDSDPTQSVLDRVISSYAYTVKSLSYAKEKAAKVVRDSPIDKAIVLSMPTTPEQAPLEFVKEEVNQIKAIFTQASIPVEDMRNATRHQVLSILPQYSIVHFTCHGESKEDPSTSCLLLEDWKDTPLTVADLTSLNNYFAKFAFLSACHSSAALNGHLLDESLNLSSAIQLAGFPSVVGTLWQIDERNAAGVAVDVYANMLQGDHGLDFERSAESLHKAVHALRERSRVLKKHLPLVWAPYIHVGI